MTRGELRAALRAAIVETCQSRGDSREHTRACMAEALDEPPETWAWWIDYFKSQERPRYKRSM